MARALLAVRKQPATGLVEYGTILAAAALLIVAGLNALAGAQSGYFGMLASNVAPPSAAVSGNPSHSTSVDIQAPPCPTVVAAGDLFTCLAVVSDTSQTAQGGDHGLTAPAPPQGSIDWVVNGQSPPVANCTLSARGGDSSQCASTMSLSNPVPVTIVAEYHPSGAGFLPSNSAATILNVVTPTPTPTATPTPAATPTATPTPAPQSDEGDGEQDSGSGPQDPGSRGQGQGQGQDHDGGCPDAGPSAPCAQGVVGR